MSPESSFSWMVLLGVIPFQNVGWRVLGFPLQKRLTPACCELLKENTKQK